MTLKTLQNVSGYHTRTLGYKNILYNNMNMYAAFNEKANAFVNKVIKMK